MAEEELNELEKLQQGVTSANIPVHFPAAQQEQLDQLYEADYFRQSAGPFIMEPKPKVPGFWETYGGMFAEANTVASAINRPDMLNPYSSGIPEEGYSPADDESLFIGVDKRFHNNILSAKNPDAANRIRQEALQIQDHEEYLARGPLLAQVLGGITGATIDLPSLIPLAGIVKYAKTGSLLIKNATKLVPGLAASSAMHEGAMYSNKVGISMEDAVVNTFVDTVGGLALVGAGLGLSKGFDGLKIWNARKIMKIHYSGIDLAIDIDNEGIVKGYKAIPGDGLSVGAKELADAQSFMDSSFAKNGLFAIPYLGGLLGKGSAVINPTIRGLTSPFKTINIFTDRSANHTFLTEAMKEGKARPENFESLISKVSDGNRKFNELYTQLHGERNGIFSDTSALGKLKFGLGKVRSRIKDDGYVTEDAFNREVIESIVTGNVSAHETVNKEVDLYRNWVDSTADMYIEAFNLPESWKNVLTSDGYYSRVYSVNDMQANVTGWESMWVDWWREGDNLINTHMQPINDIEEKLKYHDARHMELIRDPLATEDQKTSSFQELKALRKQAKSLKENLQDRLRTDKNLRLLVDEHSALSATEAKQLKKFLKPLREVEKAVKNQQEKVNSLQQQAFFAEEKAKTKTGKESILFAKEADARKAELETERESLRELKDKVFLQKDKLQEMAADGAIPSNLYTKSPESQLVKFKKPSDRLKFRKTFESDFHMKTEARHLYSRVLNQSAEQTMADVLESHHGRPSEVPTLRRSMMIPDERLLNNNFLSTNIPMVVANYRHSLMRPVILKNVFGDVTATGEIHGMVTMLQNEYDQKFRNILASQKEINKKTNKIKKDAKLSNEEKAIRIKKIEKDFIKSSKEVKKLDNEFEEAKAFMKLMHDKMMGKNNYNKKIRQFTSSMRLWTYATKLGAVSLTMISDLFAIPFKHGVFPFIRYGIVPALANIGTLIKQGKGNAYIENAGHSHLALNHVLTAYTDKNLAGIAQQIEPLGGKLNAGLEKAAHYSGNLALTNYIENFFQYMTANIVQSKVMKYMLDHKAGTLSAKNKKTLLRYGLDPEKWSDKFIKGWEQAGKDGNNLGGYQSRYWEWLDAEAANMMSMTIRKGTQDTIIRRGMFEAPFFMDDPIAATIFAFKGWVLSSYARYLVPLMHEPDAEKAIGAALMLSAGALVDPLRKISKGEAPDTDFDKMFQNAFTDSGVFSFPMDLIQSLNTIMDGELLRGFNNDRYKERTKFSTYLGPAAGIVEDASIAATHFLRGTFTEPDLKRLSRLIPGASTWYFRGLNNKLMESVGLPKTVSDYEKASAHSYR